MKATKKILIELILPFILCWFLMSAFIDILTVPTVFKYTSNLQEAGKIGMTVFGSFNSFEIIFGILILSGAIVHDKKSKLMIGTSFVLLVFAFVYKFHMTPMIANTSIKIHQIPTTDPEYQALFEQHNFYHHLYRYVDSVKLLILLSYAIFMIRLNICSKHKECQ